ncbi:MAG: LPS export ABC transporter ATP-binding protein [Bacteroidetes bacterium]|nr:LPS export ABC transporter ATP-binding protein [Bacteroidota bacterium]
MKLRTENIHKTYKGRQVVNGVSVEVNQGEIVGLLGPNGAGKTTSFYMIVGLISPNEGHVYLDDVDITHSAMYKRAKLGIGYLPQEVSVFRKMTVEDNVMAVLEMTKLNKEERKARLEVLLDEFGLQHVRKNLGQSLSGGEKRRTEIARALATDPKFILLDEPFAGVDPIAVEDIQKIVWKLKSKNIGVLITDHNVQETLSITDRTYLLFEGSILRSGSAEELAADPQVRKVYLGQNFELRRTDFSQTQVVNEEKREAEFKSDEQRNAAYISNIINLARKSQAKLNPKLNVRYYEDLLEDTKIDELIMRVNELKTYFNSVALGKRASELHRKISFGPLSNYYTHAFKWAIIYNVLAFVPPLNLLLIIPNYKRMKRCKEDLALLITKLEAMRHLVENPDLEKML